ncbi:kinase-like domain-containing protein [Haematococcus lacustris]
MSELVSSLAAADKQLGEGSEGKVLAGTLRSEPVAVKIISCSLPDLSTFSLCSLLTHSDITMATLAGLHSEVSELIPCCPTSFTIQVEVVTPIDGGPQNISVCTACVMPLASGSLHDLLLKLENCQSLPLALVVDVCIQLLHDVTEAQRRLGLLHGDIKPSNILVTVDGQISLGDTSNAVLLPDNHTSGTTSSWTIQYSCLLQRLAAAEDEDIPASFGTDTNSLGCTLLCMLQPQPLPPDEPWFSEATARTALQQVLSGRRQCGSPQVAALLAEVLEQCALVLREGDRPEGPCCLSMQRKAQVLLLTLCHWRLHTASAQANTPWASPAQGMQLWQLSEEQLHAASLAQYAAWQALPCRPTVRAMLQAVMAGQPCPELPAGQQDLWMGWFHPPTAHPLPTHYDAASIAPSPTTTCVGPPPCYWEAVGPALAPTAHSPAQGQPGSSPVQGVVDEVLELQQQLAASAVQLAATRAREALLEEEHQQLRLRLQQQMQLEADRQQQGKQVVMQLEQQVVKLQTELQSITAANSHATQQAEAALQQLHQVSHLAEATRLQQRACKQKQQQVWEAEVQQQRSRAERAEAQLHQLLATLAIIHDPTALSWCNAASSSSSGGNTPLRISLGGSDNCGVHQVAEEDGQGRAGSLPPLPSTLTPPAAVEGSRGHVGFSGKLKAAMKGLGWAFWRGA